MFVDILFSQFRLKISHGLLIGDFDSLFSFFLSYLLSFVLLNFFFFYFVPTVPQRNLDASRYNISTYDIQNKLKRKLVKHGGVYGEIKIIQLDEKETGLVKMCSHL